MSDLDPKILRRDIGKALRDWKKIPGSTGSLLEHLVLVQEERKKLEDGSHDSLRLAINQVLLKGINELEKVDFDSALLLRLRFIESASIQQVSYKLDLTIDQTKWNQATAIEKLTNVLFDMEELARNERIWQLEQSLNTRGYSELFGVEEISKNILEMLEKRSPPWIITVAGIGGIGKTSIVDYSVRTAIRNLDFEGVVWLTMRNSDFSKKYQKVLESRFDQIIYDLSTILFPRMESTASLRQRTKSVRSELKSKRFLIIFDDLELQSDIDQLLGNLISFAEPSKFILTSRYNPRSYSHTQTIIVPELNQKNSINLIRNYAAEIGVSAVGEAGDEELLQIYEVVGGHPLLIKYIVNLALHRPLYPILDQLRERDASTGISKDIWLFFDQLRDVGSNNFYEAKLLIIGEGGAGKTSLATKLVDSSTALLPDSFSPSTEGIDIIRWQFPLPEEYDQDLYYVNIWDFGGQAVYFATHQFFFTKRSVYILVTDTRRQHTDFYTWLQMQEAFGGGSPVILLKNHNRLHGNQFSIEQLPQLRKRFPNLQQRVFEIDLANVPEETDWIVLQRELRSRFLDLDHIGQPRPKTWVRIRRLLQNDIRQTISRREFIDICFAQGIKKEEEAVQLSDYLHNVGDILHFQNDSVLREIIILKPTWGLDAVYRVLDNQDINKNNGEFTLADLYVLWHESVYTGHHFELLRLMQNFQLCYPLEKSRDTYIAPQLLNEEVEQYSWDASDNLLLRYRYPVFMPRGILSRTIVKLHNRIQDQRWVWRYGVILTDGFARAELLELRGEKEIRVRVSGRMKRDFLMEIVRVLDDLHINFPQLQYEKLVPCNCVSCKAAKFPHFYPLEKLRERLSNNKLTIECDNHPYENVKILSLLDDIKISPKIIEPNIYNTLIHGDFVQGKKLQGDQIKVGNISNSKVALGREAHLSEEEISNKSDNTLDDGEE